MSNKTFNHKFLKGCPIVIVNTISEWANGNFPSDSYYQKIKFNGRPLSYILIEKDKAEKIYGTLDSAAITATIALIIGEEKYPVNPKLALKFAIEKTIGSNDKDSYMILKSIYESKYGDCPIRFDEDNMRSGNWNTPHQTDRLGDQFSTEKDIEHFIDMMDDESENDVEITEATKKPIKKPLKKTTKKPIKKSKAPTKKKMPTVFNRSKDAAKKGATKGWTHVKGGAGNLYVKGEMSQKVAQTQASREGADAKLVNGKMIPLTASEMIGMRKSQGSTSQKKKAPTKNTGNGGAKTTQKSNEQPKKKDPTVVKVAKKGSKEHQAALSARPIVKVNQKSSAAAAELNAGYIGEKNRELDPDYINDAPKNKEFTREPTISDAEFEKRNKGNWVSKEYIKLNSVASTKKLAKHTVKTLERIINTKLNNDTKKLKNHFSPEAGAGDARSQAGELMTMAFTSLDGKAAARLRDELSSFIESNGDTSILERSWVQAAYDSSRAIHKHLNKRFGEGNWESINIAWDTEKEFEAMTGLKYKESKGRSSDMYMTVNTENGPQLIDISLKKGLDIKFVNSGPEAVLKYDSSLKGSDLDVAVHINNERKWLQKVANTKRMTETFKWLKGAEKNLNRINPPKARKAVEEAILQIKEVAGKDMNQKKLMKAIHDNIDEKNVRKAAWLGIYAMSLAGASKDADKVVEDASKIYSDYQKKFMGEVSRNKKLKGAMLEMIRDNLPIGDICEGLEIMALGNNMLDKATLKEIFGTSDPKAIRDGLTVVAGPPPFIGYAAGPKGQMIPIATVRMRPEALGYGNRIKFDMDMHPKFKEKITHSTSVTYGDDKEK